MKIAQLQLPVFEEKEKNLDQLEAEIKRICKDSTEGKPDLITAGEMFTCPYETGKFPEYAEPAGGPTWKRLSGMAAEYGVYLSPGTIPEVDEEGKVYNTAFVFDREGRQIARHRKMHLFDIQVEGGQSFRESDTLSAGNEVTVFDTEFGRAGICVCFDFRFPELARLMVLQGARFILVPAAFNQTTGPAHWDVMFRSRAIDNQCWTIGTSPSLNPEASYHAWGHSLVVSPWGDIISEMDEVPESRVLDLDITETERVREQLPLLSARREDVYTLNMKLQME
ncbi:MAG: carbon-nitrogen hydrolase family protein [Eubacterium sp.]|jgi:predicted amidohydrolase|nr:carbon-nitrogen hydrolase family protein [Eubacterium sp.]MCH4046718.1 carbon-nitrogen hydrolase family protein [Eubacterium sp.]MCH4079815.1 carbon-nitrogen hydrolase family protein [Eubacterium sp.]MCH4110374.1 carbon-nitrogen hydrolase family protein [Eubacterium sp.]MCI1306434.1 carbon-nitrogen hydrolase family protein [Eubacterium sp.]